MDYPKTPARISQETVRIGIRFLGRSVDRRVKKEFWTSSAMANQLIRYGN